MESLNCKSLMIGDWVKWKDKYVQIATISGIVYSFGHIDVEIAHCGSGLIERHDLKSISPIPLTPETLERNGFERHITAPCGYYHAPAIGMYDVLFHASEDSYEDTWHTEVFTDHNDNNFVLYNLCYVHELQHLLKLVGINKEIIL